MKELDKELLSQMVWNNIPTELYEDACHILEFAYENIDEYEGDEQYAVVDELDNWLIPTYRMWKMMEEYQTPYEANFIKAYDAFLEDLMSAFTEYLEKIKEEER